MINKLAIQIRKMQELSEHWDVKNPDVSVESVGWHLLHNLKVINGMIASLAASDPSQYAPKLSYMKWSILLTKKIPRGKARAPKSALPSQIDKDELDAALDCASLSVLNLSSFYQINGKGTTFHACSMQEVDFTEANFSEALFEECDLAGALFDRTNLEKADFRNAYNYRISPTINRLKKAKFSQDGLAGLLSDFGIANLSRRILKTFNLWIVGSRTVM